MKLDALKFHAIEPRLPYGVTVMTRSCLSFFEHGAFRQESFGQLRLATSRHSVIVLLGISIMMKVRKDERVHLF